MDKIKIRKTGIALLMLMLMAGNMTMNSWAKALSATGAVDSYVMMVDAEEAHFKANEEVMDELWGSFLTLGSPTDEDAHISDINLGKDKKISEPTDEFGTTETIFAAVEIAENKKTLKVKGRLHVVDIEGLKPGPIQGIEVVVTVTGENVANFQFSKPTKGWPVGKYMFEALLIDASGETIDTGTHEFIVH